MKNILLIILNSAYGGAERHVLDICKYYDSSKYNLSLIVPKDSKIEKEALKFKNVNVRTVNRGLKSVSNIAKLIKEMEPDTIHVHSPRAALISAIAVSLANFKGNFVTTAHGWIPNRLKLSKVFEFVYLLALRRYTKIIAVSNEVKEILHSKNIPLDKITTIYNGVEIGQYEVNETVSRKAIFLGRFIDEKGIPYLMEAIKQINNSEVKDQLAIDFYGDGPLRPYVTETIDELNSTTIRNCGFLDPSKVIETLHHYDMLIMPSLQEGFPYTLVEAFSAGVPVIASRVGGIPEALVDGFNGYLTNPGNSEDLKSAIIKFLTLDESKLVEMKHNALNTSKKFDVNDMLRFIEKTY